MVWSQLLPKKSLVGGGGDRPNLMYSLGPSGPDLGPDLDLSLTINPKKTGADTKIMYVFINICWAQLLAS